MGAEFNIATLVETVAGEYPDRIAVVHGNRRLNYRQFVDRCRRLGRLLADHGMGCYAERDGLAGHEAGQDRLAQYLFNGPEYLEGLIGGYLVRAAPFNINYRYVTDELGHLLADAQPRAIQYHGTFAPVLAATLAAVPHRDLLLLQVDDGSGEPLLPGALDYDQALASVEPRVDAIPDPDDLYVLYTGGTTGLPKGVLWRQADVAVTALGLVNGSAGREWESLQEFLSERHRTYPAKFVTCAPLIHGAAQWGALRTLCDADTVVFPVNTKVFDAAQICDTVVGEAVSRVLIVGDPFARALIEELERHPRDLSSLRFLVSGGAPLQPEYKRRLLALAPGLSIVEAIGSSETGVQGRTAARDAVSADMRTFNREGRTVVVSEDRSHFLRPGHSGIGWLASRGRVPLGYLGDEQKTREAFPTVDGQRVSLPGDRARLLADDTVELLGRESTTINTGGEKVFAEEVEAAVKAHPDVADAVVCGRPSPRWGSEVVAILAWRPGALGDASSVRAHCAKTLARYKLPKAIIVVDRVERSPSGKADYRWALATAADQPRPSSVPIHAKIHEMHGD